MILFKRATERNEKSMVKRVRKFVIDQWAFKQKELLLIAYKWTES